ncbi:WG repeat-containing protein [Flammeovirgaceae bacterium SG7u.111]|nr:WG repeat-containing protein [Flammeovirgaceae bacterium SG7u.132]WPO35789.1 WG repeat-containing protein [Flammeovirgaceae bacterium SG7u.111]
MNPIHKNLFFTFFLLLISSFSFSQTLFPVREGGKWGAIGQEGKLVIPAKYEHLGSFGSHGLAIFQNNGKSGLVDGKGTEVIPANYEQVKLLKVPFAVVWEDGKCGLVDLKNQVVLPLNYQLISPLSPTLLRTYTNNLFGLASIEGKVLLENNYDEIKAIPNGAVYAEFSKGGKKGLYNQFGEILLSAQYEAITLEQGVITAKKGNALTAVKISEDGKLLEKNEYPNQVALNVATQNALKKERIAILKANPEARKPRWVEHDYRTYLENGVGQNLLGKREFFDVGIDDELGLSMAREILLPEKKGEKETIYTYLIDHKQGKILFKSNCKDMVVTDFKEAELARVTVDTLWDGLIDKAGNIISEIGGSSVSNIGAFEKGRAWAKSGGKFGVIDGKGNVVVPFEYDVISDFSEGYAIARKNGKFGCIDGNGKAVLPFMFDGIQVPAEGACIVKKGRGKSGKWGLVNLQNKQLLPFEYSMIYPFKNGIARMRVGRKWGAVSTKGKVLFPASVELDGLEDFENGIALTGRGRQQLQSEFAKKVLFEQKGYINENGEVLLTTEYSDIIGFEEIWKNKRGIAKIMKDGKTGYVNYNGVVVLEPSYERIDSFENIWGKNAGLAKVYDGKNIGYIDYNAQEVLPPTYSYIDTAFNTVWRDSLGLAKAAQKGKYGYIDYTGKAIIPLKYDFASPITNGLVVANQGGKWGIIDLQNQVVLPFEYDGIRPIGEGENTLFELLKKEEKYFLVEKNGTLKELSEKPSLEPAPAGSFSKSDKLVYETEFDANGLAVVKKSDKLALADKTGKLLTKYAYVEIHPFSDGLALVKAYNKDRTQQKFGFIDQNGAEVIPATYKLAASFSDGKAAVLSRNLWGYIDKTGKSVIKQSFKKAAPFSNGFAFVNDKQIIDEKGAVVGSFGLKGKVIDGFKNDRAIVESTGGFYHIKPDGLPAYPTKFDEVTNYVGDIAFAKRGEIWELTRQVDGNEVKLNFTRGNKEAYLEKYGARRSEKLKYGQVLKDVSWKKIVDGKWKMIDKGGNIMSEVIYSEVYELPDGSLAVMLENFSGLADKEGKLLLEPENELIKHEGSTILSVEKLGKSGYISANGTWVWKIK